MKQKTRKLTQATVEELVKSHRPKSGSVIFWDNAGTGSAFG